MHRNVTAALVALALVASWAPLRAAGAAPVVVPFDLVDGHIFVTARVNGTPLRFVVDTGAGDVLAADTAQTLGLHLGAPFSLYGTGESAEQGRDAHGVSLDVGGLVLRNQEFTVVPFEKLRAVEGVARFDGLIGHELFDRYVVRIDYEARTLTLSDSGTQDDVAPAVAEGSTVPLRFFGSMPEVAGDVDGIAGEFTVDTGDRGSLSLLVPFIEQHGLIARYRPSVEGIAGWGIGGPVRAKLTRVGHLRFGPIDVQRPVTRLPEAQHGFFTSRSVAGNIGAGILRRFTVTFDYAQRRMILEANGAVDQPDVYDRSGMWLIAKDAGFGVANVIPDGPAASAGVRVGDVIESFDGRAAADIGLAQEREALRTAAPGTLVTLRILRAQKAIDATLRLEDLV